ncbi:uncharacterized protein LOC116215346 isoform X2 [Punica granatum]|uniref:Uncharacterized protein LOC116215346 isoform X2 n=1 Tax=Punica granatum TaxID=22663 RepID=A0A6P8EA65_PUNGR|nr:uncharacterized protein LOC116215346 isoform X2 [Punica granatum]
MKMSTARGRASTKPTIKHDPGKMEMQGTMSRVSSTKSTTSQRISSGEKKLALQRDVDKLKKKLRHEEDVRKALERAFSRPLGTLPRLPPCLPVQTLELVAEVAVLEEEVVRLEEQVVHFRQDLYKEAVHVSSSKRRLNRSPSNLSSCLSRTVNLDHKLEKPKSTPSRIRHMQSFSEGGGKEDGISCSNPVKKEVHCSTEKATETQKFQLERRVKCPENATESRNSLAPGEGIVRDNNPNRISEDILKCLSSIIMRKSSLKNRGTAENVPFLSPLMSGNHSGGRECRDPYCICSEYGERDIGPYKDLPSIEAGSIKPSRTGNYMFLEQRLRILHGKLAKVKLRNLTHQEKLAFWINIYNSCMMNGYLEYGIPESPDVVVALMQQATINVGGHSLNPITIEHFILRLPYHSKYNFPKGTKNNEMTARSMFGLELSEPLVTFALSCGSWSSPAVRVYTASQVEDELEAAKRDYLQASVGISPTKFGIPKLLDWYLLDFAKDLDSLLDWICLQLPSDLGKEAIKSLEKAKSKPLSQFVQILPYDFSFRNWHYLEIKGEM